MADLKKRICVGALSLLLFLQCGCGVGKTADDSEIPPAETAETAAAAETPVTQSDPAENPEIRITEIMLRNHATLRDADGDFPDWIELRNETDRDLNLEGWSLTDNERRDGLVFPAFLLPAGTTFVVYASGKNRPEELHAPFALSEGETLILRNPDGETVCQVPCTETLPDRSLALQEDGSFRECRYPTPWQENTTAAYDELQRAQASESPILINEVLVSDPNSRFSDYQGSDWVELKNVSSAPVSLEGWYLSDDDDNYWKAKLPSVTLEPGQLTVVRCDQLGIGLDSEQDALFLSRSTSGLQDWLVLRDIPYGGSYGRLSGQNGGFFFPTATPNEENRDGKRRVSAMPAALTADGVFEGDEPVVLDLQAEGRIYYTYDTSLPTERSAPWVGPTRIPATCIIRAVAIEENALPSIPLTLSYFINEKHSLPIVSLVTDNKEAFQSMYKVGWKGLEWPGNLAFYEEGGSFSLPCGISMHGETSLVLLKKGMGIRFRGVYGAESLHYDIFGGGVQDFTNLILRSGQDQTSAIIRNELCENLALAASDSIVGSRGRYCVLYIDGVYSGIYALSEKMNEQHYANLAGVSRDSVTVVDADDVRKNDLYEEVFQFCSENDMSEQKNYEHFLTLMDPDSLLDWIFLEGYFANSDLTYGNLRFCRSSENDGRWRLMFYDLDATLASPYMNHSILLHRNYMQSILVSHLFADLMENEDFRDHFLTRTAALLSGPLTEKKVLAEIDRLAGLVDPEARRDMHLQARSYESWKMNVDYLRAFIKDNKWTLHNIDAVCKELKLSAEEREHYFGSLIP